MKPIRLAVHHFLVVAALSAILIPGSNAAWSQESQATFANPGAAMTALQTAVASNDTQRILKILGPDSKDLVSSDDPVADKEGRRRFLEAHKARCTLMTTSDGSVVAGLGKEAWPFPIPMVKEGQAWRFNTQAGHQEVINRRIGENESIALKVCDSYVLAQREYFSSDRQGDSIVEYAQRFLSQPGKRDGLYWKVDLGEELSPMGPEVAAAEAEGYKPGNPNPAGFHGYKFRIITEQGASAPGGAYDYVINGHMVAGFALAAYPAHPGQSGVMTYIVNQNGIIYRKDLGAGAEQTVKSMNYSPDASWNKL